MESPPREPDPVEVAATLASLPELLGSAVALPRYREAAAGERAIEGFEVTYVRPSGAAERLGLRTGDVILDVNGQVLDGMVTVMRLFDEMQAMGRATITMLRDGQRMSVVLRTK